jgi:hypothetical protein
LVKTKVFNYIVKRAWAKKSVKLVHYKWGLHSLDLAKIMKSYFNYKDIKWSQKI